MPTDIPDEEIKRSKFLISVGDMFHTYLDFLNYIKNI